MPREFPFQWLALGLAALFLSSADAFFLVLCRLPGVSFCSTGGFATLLVYHVDFAVLVWFLSMAGAFLSITGPSGPLERPALMLVWLGALALLAAPALGAVTPVLSNYFPVLANPWFLGGMATMGVGGGLMAVHRLRHGADSPGVTVACWALLCALGAFVVRGVEASPHTHEGYERLFWAGGHLLQHAHVLLLASLWLWLRKQEDPAWIAPGYLTPLFAVALLPSLAGLLWINDAGGIYTELMRWSSWWVVPGVAWLAWSGGGASGESRLYARLSLVLLLAGLGMGVLAREGTLLVPSHYHAAVGAVTLGYMGMVRTLLVQKSPAGTLSDRMGLERWQPFGFFLGVLLLVAGLAVAGISGAPRKTPGIEHAWDGVIQGGILLAVTGGLLSAASSLWFVWRIVPMWWRARGDGRSSLVPVTLLAVASLAALVEIWPSAPVTVVPVRSSTELERRFQQGVVMLHAKQYEHAVTSFHWVLKQAPRMPEAHVNLGYALLGLKRFKPAEDFFRAAIELRPYQANAYYGLAEALEGRGELRAALGAMRTFIHLSGKNDPYLPRARAALWEWEERLRVGLVDAAKGGKVAQPAVLEREKQPESSSEPSAGKGQGG